MSDDTTTPAGDTPPSDPGSDPGGNPSSDTTGSAPSDAGNGAPSDSSSDAGAGAPGDAAPGDTGSGASDGSGGAPGSSGGGAPSGSGANAPGGSGGGRGGMSGVHPVPAEPPRLVGPATDDKFNAIKMAILPVACWRVDDVRFQFDSSFVLPAAQPEMQDLANLVKAHPGAPLSIFGHADPTGSDDYNKTLSGRRARAVYGMLLRDTDTWEDLYKNPLGNDNWSHVALQTMLLTVGYDPGSTSGTLDGPTQDALKNFQSANGLSPSGSDDAPTRAKLFAAYMDALCGPDFKLDKTDFLAQGADPDGKGDVQGCGEFNPYLVFSKDEQSAYNSASDHTARDADNAPNRRVVAFLFRKGTTVDPTKWPCPSVKEGVTKCHKRFWSDGETRRSNQDARREYKDTKDTFACRFYDRLGGLSPCEAGPPVPQDYRITITLGDIDTLFPAIAVKDHSDLGVQQRLQAIGFLYAQLPLTGANVQTALDAWSHFKDVVGKADNDAAVTELQKMVREQIVDAGKLPDPGAFAKLRVPGAYCVTNADYSAGFFGNPGIHGQRAARFNEEANVWQANANMGFIPLIATVEAFDGTNWGPAPAGVQVHFQLIAPDALPAGQPVTPPPLRTTSTVSVNGATTLTMNGSPDQYVSCERVRNAPTAGDPLVDNVHSTVGGKRGVTVAGTNRVNIDGNGINTGNLLEITNTHAGFHDVNNFTASTASSHPNAVLSTTNSAGKAAAIFMPAFTGGDRYKFRAFLDPAKDGAASDGTEPTAIKAETGTLVLWRILRLSNYLRWDYPASCPPAQRAQCSGALDTFDVSGVITTEYQKAFMDVTPENYQQALGDAVAASDATAPRTLTQAEWLAMTQFMRGQLAAHISGGTLALSRTYDLTALFPDVDSAGAGVNNPNAGIINFADPTQYNARRGATFTNVPDPPTNAAANNYWQDMEKLMFAAMDEVMQFVTKNAISGLTIIQAPVMTSLESKNIAGMPSGPNANWNRSGWGTARRGCFVVFGSGTYANQGFPYDATHNAMHETGHVLYGVHQYTAVAQFNTPAGTGGIFDEHDYHDICTMSYMSARPGAGHGFCGRCVLNQGGWNTRAIPTNGPPTTPVNPCH